MTKSRLVCVFMLLLCLSRADAQVTKFLAAEAGVNGFFGTEAADVVGSTFHVGFGLRIGEANQMQLLTQLNVGNNRYKSKLSESTKLLVDQRVVHLSAKVAVPVAKDATVYLGLFASLAFKGQTSESYSSFVSVMITPSSNVRVNYSNQFQSGLVAGTILGFGQRKRGFLDVQIRQHLSAMFSKDVNWNYSQGESIMAFNAGALATSLVLGLGVFLK